MKRYFRVGNKVDELPIYAAADNQKEAVDAVEDMVGPIAPRLLTVKEVRREEIPEGESILGEEDSTEDEG